MDTKSQPVAEHPKALVDVINSPPSLPSILALEVQGLALRIIATVALIYALHWAQSFLISLLLGILLAYTVHLNLPKPTHR
jgi:hypothetical protein